MKFTSPKQLKDWIKNKVANEGIPSNTIIQTYMMERFLERISESTYSDNFIIKGGFLIASILGLNSRSTMDIDTTITGLPIDKESIERILYEIVNVEVDDNVSFKIVDIKSIHDVSDYDDFRVNLEGAFFTIRQNIKIDITTGDLIIPEEIDFSYKLMFDEKEILVKAYNLETILAEKIETIISRNVLNTRARDYYDIYILAKTKWHLINDELLVDAIVKKFEERDSTVYLKDIARIYEEISRSTDLKSAWNNYQKKYEYAKGIDYFDVLTEVLKILELLNKK
ncbi:MAG: nucleotidyl transferase AbiEii/AbiGii toxin family protein [Clostridiales bacterium]|nr:nucleotidyl transferase AbiEii/AbiGii toxin family protein [Clostridiales bacterium]